MNLLATPLPFNISASIDGRSGTIQVSQLLDYESYREYKFEVHLHTYSLTHSLIHSFTHSFIHSFIHSLGFSS